MKITRRRSVRGLALVEFSFVAFQLVLGLLAVVEFGRMVLVATSVAHSARTAIRYAVVHGVNRTGTGADGPSSSADYSQITANVKKYASSGLLDTNSLTITVAYPDGNNNAGSRVRVTVVYPYNAFTLLPLGVNLGSTTEGVICY